MANAWILRPQPIVGAYAPALQQASAIYPANDYAGVVWSNPGTAMYGNGPYTHLLDIDLGAAVAADAMLLFGLPGGLPADATVILQGLDVLNGQFQWGSEPAPLYAGSVRLANGRGVSLWTSAAPQPMTRFYRIVIASATRFDVSIARIVIGSRYRLERNFAFGAAFGVRDLGNLDFSRRGVLLRQRGKKLRTTALTFSSLRREEVEGAIAPMMELDGITEPIALVTDPAAHAMRERRCYFGMLAGDLGTVWRNAAAWEWKANLVSLF